MQDQLLITLKREEQLKNQLSVYTSKFDTITDLVSKNKETLVIYQTELKKVLYI